jgi:cobalt-zinc-cadmium efflux system outer membrane protein
MLCLPIPLINRNQGGIRLAQAELIAAQNEMGRVELDLRQRLAAAYGRYANARQQVDRYSRDILPDARESLELVDGGYRQGEFSFLTLLTAQRTYFQTNLAYVEALRQLRENTVAIEGLLLTDSLQQAAETR